MTSIFSSPKKPDLPPAPEPVEEVSSIIEDEDAAKKEKKKLASTGRTMNMLSGIASALKKRLGE